MRTSGAGLILALLVQALDCHARPIVNLNSDDTIGYNDTIGYKLLVTPFELPKGKDAGPFVLLHLLNGQCIQPLATDKDNTSLREGVALVLLSDGCDRDSQNTQFIFTAAGHLQHVGTETCVAPASDSQDGNPTAVLTACSKHSTNSSQQWSVTANMSLQHLGSRKCLHPQGGTANPGVTLQLQAGCNEDRLVFVPTPPSEIASSLSEHKQPLTDAQLEVSIGRNPSVVPAPLCCSSKDCVPRKARRLRHTFLTTARSGPYVAAMKGLVCSLAKSNPGSHLVVLAGSSDAERLSAEQLDYLRHNASIPGLTVQYKVVRDIDFPNYSKSRFRLNWIKLQAWNLTNWDAVIMIDADTVVVDDLKHLFNLPHHSATVPFQALGKYGYNSGGFMFLRPCRAVFEHMLSLLLEYPSLQFRDTWSEQGFLRWYFYYDTYNLPMQYHANAHQHSDLGSNGKVTGLEPILIHFADEKPWQVPESDALYKYATPCNSSFPVKPVSRGAPAAGHHRRRRQHARWSELVNG